MPSNGIDFDVVRKIALALPKVGEETIGCSFQCSVFSVQPEGDRG
jgi:hypothetical protein